MDANTSAQLDGFDINPTNFPDPAFVPVSVTLKKLDILVKTFPSDLNGVYDVVHIRAFDSVITNAYTLKPVLAVASELLKPGGFLQWEEIWGDKFYVESPSPQTSKVACSTISQVLEGALRAQGISNEWDVRLLAQEKRKQDFKAWTEDYLMVWEEIAPFFPPKATNPNAPMSHEAWVDIFANGVKETEHGVVVHQGSVLTVVGQKPMSA
ncbi:hypothetical protein PG990_012299 [Apiospora arundinis]